MTQFDEKKLDQFLAENKPLSPGAPLGEEARIQRTLKEENILWFRLGWRRYLLPITAAALLVIALFPLANWQTSQEIPNGTETILAETLEILYAEDEFSDAYVADYAFSDEP